VPRNSRDQKVLWLVFRRIDELDVAPSRGNDAQFDNWIWITGFRIWCDFNFLIKWNVVHDSELGNRPFVNFQKGYGAGIRTPPVSAKISTAIQFFLVNPVETSVKKFWSAVGSARSPRCIAISTYRLFPRMKLTVRPSGLKLRQPLLQDSRQTNSARSGGRALRF
jgi:hypothetical protein